MTGPPSACPVCGLTDNPDRIYRHLLVGHRKSAVAKALLDTAPDPEHEARVSPDREPPMRSN